MLLVDPWGLTWQQDVEFVARGVGVIVWEVHREAFRQASQVVATTFILGRVSSIAQLSHIEAAVLENSLKAGDILNRVGGTNGRDFAQRIDSKIQAIKRDVYGTPSTSMSNMSINTQKTCNGR